MHKITLNPELEHELSQGNCHAVTVADVVRFAKLLRIEAVCSQLRRGKQRAIIADRKFGAAADRLVQEFASLTEQVTKVRGSESLEEELQAAAFFHLRFENIHPLLDGNGRVGRLLLAEQCHRAGGFPVAEILAALHAHEPEYRAIFAAPRLELGYELMLDLLSRLLAVPMTLVPKVTFSLSPVFPERDTRPPTITGMKHVQPKRRSAFF